MGGSIWTKDMDAPTFTQLQGNLSCNVLVIGGGMAGILIAYFLLQRGIDDVVVVEGNRIGYGVTKNTTAVVSAQHDTLYHQLAKKHGAMRAKEYLTANLESVERFAELGSGYDFERRPSVMYTLTNPKAMQKEVDFLNKIGYEAQYVTESTLPFSIAAGVRFPRMAQFHPLKLLYSLAKQLTIYEKSFVTRIKDGIAYVDSHKIDAKHIVVATHFPFLNSKGLYFLKMHQRRSYVLGLDGGGALDATYTSYDKDGLYFRNYQNVLLVGGIDRRVGKRVCGFDGLRAIVKEYYPQSTELYAFAAQDCVTLDGVPYIGRYGGQKNLLVASGFNEWGMTSAMVAAQLLSEAIVNGKTDVFGVFKPQRSMLRAQLFANIGTAILNFIKPSTKRCAHLGCALTYNPFEHTWECPCHGSRFDRDGALLDNPAMEDKKL